MARGRVDTAALVERSAVVTSAHDQLVTHRYLIRYPAHEPRRSDPHYIDFDHYHRRTRHTARCQMGERLGYSECRDAKGQPAPAPTGGPQPGLELHHAHIEFALQNAVNLELLEKDYPGVSNRDQVGAWVESAANFMWLCAWHHRGAGGIHSATASDWEAERYVLGLIREAV